MTEQACSLNEKLSSIVLPKGHTLSLEYMKAARKTCNTVFEQHSEARKATSKKTEEEERIAKEARLEAFETNLSQFAEIDEIELRDVIKAFVEIKARRIGTTLVKMTIMIDKMLETGDVVPVEYANYAMNLHKKHKDLLEEKDQLLGSYNWKPDESLDDYDE
jgi:hypothetical protein